jgi:hypothetical protein
MGTSKEDDMTYLSAKRAFQAGNKELAWLLAQQDEGLLPGTTKEAFFAHVAACLEQDAQTEKAYAA